MNHGDYEFRENHIDIIKDLDFMEWCDRQNDRVDHVKCRRVALLFANVAPTEVARQEGIKVVSVYPIVRKYESIAKKYKAERDAAKDTA